MDNAVISRILTMYGYQDFSLLPLEKGYRNESHPFRLKDGRIYNLILFKHEPGSLTLIKHADRTMQAALEAGLLVRAIADPRLIQLKRDSWHKYGRVYTYLPGATIPWEAYQQIHIKLLGKNLSDLHAALKNLSSVGYPRVAEQYLLLVEHMQAYFSQAGVERALREKLCLSINAAAFSYFSRILRASSKLEQQQVLHMDFVRSNILFAKDPVVTISGILDFEKTAVGHPLFDIARTLAFLLVDCKYKSEEQIRKYFLYSGYQRRGQHPFSRVIIRDHGQSYPLLEILLSLFLFYDFYKFLRHNPYESLPTNEHFMRTRAILLDRGLIYELEMIQ